MSILYANEYFSIILFLVIAHSFHEYIIVYLDNFPGGKVVKKPPAVKVMQVPSLGQKDSLEKEMETHSTILAWEIPWTEEPVGLQSTGSQRVRKD